MAKKDWYKLTFEIDSNLAEILIWKFNNIGIFSYAFEYLLKTAYKKKVNIWLPIADWDEIARYDLEFIISELLNINDFAKSFFVWSVIGYMRPLK